MKKRSVLLLKLLVVFFIILNLTSCIETQYTYKLKTSRISEPVCDGYITPWVADIQLLSPEKITYSETFNIIVNQFTDEKSIENYKNYVLGVALSKNNADIILSPLFEVETTVDGYLKITITGYPGKYINIRNATINDEWFIQQYNQSSIKTQGNEN